MSCRSLKSCRESRRLIGQGDVFTDNLQAASQGHLVFLTLPDDIIPQVTEELASAADDWSHTIYFSLQRPALLTRIGAAEGY